MATATEQGHGGGGGGGHHDEEEHEEHVNHEAWAIPYADMVTLLMALFLMLYALSTLDLKKFEALKASLGQSLGGQSAVIEPLDGDAGGPDPIALEGSGSQPDLAGERARDAEQALAREERLARARVAEDQSLERVRETVERHAAEAGLSDSLKFTRTARGLVVTVVSDKVLFQPGSARLQPLGRRVLGLVADAVRPLPNHLMVEGHTDDRPISTSQFPSNWELSTERATQVLRELVERRGIPAKRVSAAGYGEHHPVASNESLTGRTRNRRVELVVLSEVPIVPQ